MEVEQESKGPHHCPDCFATMVPLQSLFPSAAPHRSSHALHPCYPGPIQQAYLYEKGHEIYENAELIRLHKTQLGVALPQTNIEYLNPLSSAESSVYGAEA